MATATDSGGSASIRLVVLDEPDVVSCRLGEVMLSHAKFGVVVAHDLGIHSPGPSGLNGPPSAVRSGAWGLRTISVRGVRGGR